MKNKNFFGISHPDGEMVLRAVNALETEKDFLKKAEEYLRKTRGRFIPLKDPYVIEIVSNEDEWGIVGETDIEGERWKAYCSEIDYDYEEDMTRQVKMKSDFKGHKLNSEQTEALEDLISSMKAMHELYDEEDPDMQDSADTLISATENFLFKLGAIKELKL